MSALLTFTISFYVVSHCMLVIIVVDGGHIAKTPKEIYQISKLNWFGSTVICILLIIIFPINYLIELIIFLFTVGRKN